MAASTPAWMNDELQDEWVEEPPADAAAALQSSGSSNGGVPSSLRGPSGAAAGTFIVREDKPVQAILARTPGAARGKANDFFSPLPLQKLFNPPTPPEHSGPAGLSQLPVIAEESQPGSRVTSGTTQVDWHEDEDDNDNLLDQEFDGEISDVDDIDSPRSLNDDDYQYDQQDVSDDVEPPQEQADVHESPEPMSPPSDEILDTDIPNLGEFNGRKPSRAFQFTFNVPQRPPASPARPQQPPQPTAGTPLRLFQLQYDTYTRDHMSALIDSLADSPDPAKNAQPRSTKRLRLSPPVEANGSRKAANARNYLLESKSLMQQIKSARSFTLDSPAGKSLVHEAERRDSGEDEPRNEGAGLSRAEEVSPNENGKRGIYSSLARVANAKNLMARIKSDWEKHRVMSSGTTIPSLPSAPSSPAKSTLNKRNTEKENEQPQPDERQVARRPVKSTPRKLLRRLSAADEVDRELALQNLDLNDPTEPAPSSRQPPHPQTHAIVPPVVMVQHTTSPAISNLPVFAVQDSANRAPGLLHPTGSARNVDDLNRFVSSSTAASSVPSSTTSCVKHAGPPAVMRIAPSDVPTLPERVGAMMFDKEANRWVKADVTETSDDPFRDIESLRDSLSAQGSIVEHGSATEDEDDEPFEDEMATERYDAPTHQSDGSLSDHDAVAVRVLTGVADSDDDDLDWLADPAVVTYPATDMLEPRPSPFDSRSPMPHCVPPSFRAPGPYLQRVPSPNLLAATSAMSERPTMPSGITFSSAPAQSTPLPIPIPVPAHVQTTPIPQRSTPPVPRSALKNTQTPLPTRRHRRSVSFSDGRKDGKIRGLRSDESSSGSSSSEEDTEKGKGKAPAADASSKSMSLRSKRIANMFSDLEDPTWTIDTPSKCSLSSSTKSKQLAPTPRPEFSRVSEHRSGVGNQTFLTECSFGVAHDRLVQVITDVAPWEPYWSTLLSIDLSKKNIESLARLKEWLPRLEEVNLNGNRIEWLTGAPKTLRKLSLRDNWVTSLTAFKHLPRLEVLDLTKNQLDSVQQLECLPALRELILDGNEIASIAGLQGLSRLEKLHLRANKLQDLDFRDCKWPNLESLDLSKNGLRTIQHLDVLAGSLVSLNIDGNKLNTIGSPRLPKLRVLRASDNSLKSLDLRDVPSLRTLYADGNKLRSGAIQHLGRLRRLENLSLRNQGGNTPAVIVDHDLQDVKRLYLSANPLPLNFLQEACFSVVYLELAACRLECLPANFAELVPNVRVLNLNYNFLSDLSPLGGLSRLRKLTAIGSRLTSVRGVIRILRGMKDIEMVDFRMNPFSLGWYLPLLVRDVPGALQPSDSASKSRKVGMGSTWEELDRKFRSDLPDGSYIGRLAYRGLVMEACPGVGEIDGVTVKVEEQKKAQQLLSGVAKAQGKRAIEV